MLHYSKRLVPVPPTYERIGAGLGRPFSDLIFAKWGFNNVTDVHAQLSPGIRGGADMRTADCGEEVEDT